MRAQLRASEIRGRVPACRFARHVYAGYTTREQPRQAAADPLPWRLLRVARSSTTCCALRAAAQPAAQHAQQQGGRQMKATSMMIAAVALLVATGARAQTPQIATEEMMVPSDPGIEIFVRNKRPAGMTVFRPERTVLYVHGATYPSSTSFDLKLDGLSWMEYIAARGYDVYLLDLRGYGKSTRPKEMADDPKNNPPIVRGDTAAKDV